MSTVLDYSEENISPDIAEQYLSKNKKNRALKEARIKRYARLMNEGLWVLTGEAIKFDLQGNLIDGQNRLHGVIRSGRTVTMTVIRGIRNEAMASMDSGAIRSGADAVKLNDFQNSKDLAAAIQIHAAWDARYFNHCLHSLGSFQRLANAEVLSYARENPNITESTTFATRFKSHLGLPVGALSVAYSELTRIDADEAMRFFSNIQDMRFGGDGDPIKTLYKRVSVERSRGRRIEPALGLYFIFRAWNAVRAGEPLTKFQIGSADVGFSAIPEPK